MVKIVYVLLLSLLSIAGAPTSSEVGDSPDRDSVAYTLLIFEGSDWCASCRKFEQQILSDSTVVDFLAQSAVELIKVDFPQRKKLDKEQVKTNERLAKKYGFQGVFPTVVLAPESREEYYTLNAGSTTPKMFVEWLEDNIHLEDD